MCNFCRKTAQFTSQIANFAGLTDVVLDSSQETLLEQSPSAKSAPAETALRSSLPRDSAMAFTPSPVSLRFWTILVLGVLLLSSASHAEDLVAMPPLEAQFEERVRRDPSDSVAWRMLGRIRMERSDWTGALNALQTAIQLDEMNAAAFYDYGLVSHELGKDEQAAGALQRVLELAPDSEYATSAEATLSGLAGSGVALASYEIRSFDGSNDAPIVKDPRDDEDPDSFFQTLKKDLDLRIDFGTQWNDNVSLTPSSRELLAGNQASAQANTSISARYIAISNEQFRFGPTLDIDYTFNEGHFDRLNLQSYRSGVFADAIFELYDIKIKPRVAYSFTHDLFGGNTYGRRHTLASSVGFTWTPTQITTAYWSIDTNQINNNKPDPLLNSQSGLSNTVGVLHDYVRKESRFRTFRVGADVAHVDAEGSNFRYNAFSLFAQSVVVVVPRLHLTTRGGWAYRDYYDFTSSPTRDTNVWRAGAELRKYFDGGLSAAIVSQYDTFQTPNDNFRSNRFLVGGVLTWEY